MIICGIPRNLVMDAIMIACQEGARLYYLVISLE
jgi:hypothetical protein